MLHAVFHRGLVRPDLVLATVEQRAPAGVHPQRDLVVLGAGLHVGRAIWLTLYPNVMVEWYPQVLVVSTLIPRGPQRTTNIIEFYYPEEVALFEREFVEANRAAYMETCAEDDEIALRMDAGRRALFERGENQVGPYQSPMEDGMQHFHEWLRTEMGE